jgi:hypothetical protein
MKKLLLTIALILSASAIAYSQDVTFSQAEANRIEEQLREAKAQRQVILALTAENAAKDVVIEKQRSIITTQEDKDKLRVKELEEIRKIKCSEFRFLFGIIKWRACGK